MNWELFGLAAGAMTISGFIPQIIKGYMTKRLDDLSYLLGILISIGMLMWLFYGIHIKSISLIIANIMGVLFNLTLVFMKYIYSRRSQTENAKG